MTNRKVREHLSELIRTTEQHLDNLNRMRGPAATKADTAKYYHQRIEALKIARSRFAGIGKAA